MKQITQRIPRSYFPTHSPRTLTQGQSYLVNSAAALVLHRAEGGKHVSTVIKERWPDNENLEVMTRAATSPANTTTSGYAAELLGIGVADFVGLLSPASAAAALIPAGIQLEWTPGIGQLMIQAVKATTTAVDWVEEGKPSKVPQLDLSPYLKLLPKKLRSACVFSREIAEHSVPAIEQLVRAGFSEAVSLNLDSCMLDNAAADTKRPAGLRNGINALAANGSTTKLPWPQTSPRWSTASRQSRATRLSSSSPTPCRLPS
jgi:hypothetical protein